MRLKRTIPYFFGFLIGSGQAIGMFLIQGYLVRLIWLGVALLFSIGGAFIAAYFDMRRDR